MMLVYNADSDRYEGRRLAVPRSLFDDCVDELVEGGLDVREARRRLLDEGEWSDDIAGVELVLDAGRAVSEAERIVRQRSG